jgi:hypothetical protein
MQCHFVCTRVVSFWQKLGCFYSSFLWLSVTLSLATPRPLILSFGHLCHTRYALHHMHLLFIMHSPNEMRHAYAPSHFTDGLSSSLTPTSGLLYFRYGDLAGETDCYVAMTAGEGDTFAEATSSVRMLCGLFSCIKYCRAG